MKPAFALLPLCVFAVACSSSSQQSNDTSADYANDIVSKTVSAQNVSTVDTTIKESETEPIAELPEAYSRFKLDALDTATIAITDTVIMTEEVIVPDETPKDTNIFRSAFNAGASFAAPAMNDSTLKSSFSNILLKAEQNGNPSSAAIMMAGKYFKTLQICAQNNRNEVALKQGIDGLDNLTAYLNDAMQSNHDIKTNLLLQKIIEKANLCRTMYQKCNEENSASADKYRPLADTLSVIQNGIFSKPK